MGAGASVSTFPTINEEYQRLVANGEADEDIFKHMKKYILQQNGNAIKSEEYDAFNASAFKQSSEDYRMKNAEQLTNRRVSDNRNENLGRERSPTLPARIDSASSTLSESMTLSFTFDVLYNPCTFKLFLKFCKEFNFPEYAPNRINFWVDVDSLRALPSAAYTQRRLQKIYDKFLDFNAQTPICVPTSMMNEISEAVENREKVPLTAGVFANAQNLCYSDINKSIYPGFKKSKYYTKMVQHMKLKSSKASEDNDSSDESENSLHDILLDPSKLRFLKSYSMDALVLESLLFYIEVEDCKRLPNKSFATSSIRKIYEKYCSVNAKKNIALEDDLMKGIQSEFDHSSQSVGVSIFEEAQYRSLDYIKDELWPAFSRYKDYLTHIQAESESTLDNHPLKRVNSVPSLTFTEQERSIIDLTRSNSSLLMDRAMEISTYDLTDFLHDDYSVIEVEPINDPLRWDSLKCVMHDAIGRNFLRKFMKNKSLVHYLTFWEEVAEFKALPGIDYMKNMARKIFHKYISENAKLQVDMSTSIRDDIKQKLQTPTVDMFKIISARVKNGLLQDAMPRFVKSEFFAELKSSSELAGALEKCESEAASGKLEMSHLDLMLHDQHCFMYFQKFCQSQHCSENLMMLGAVEEFRRLPSYQIVTRSAKKIFDKYICRHNSHNCVNLSDAVYNRVAASIEHPTKSSFNDAEQVCIQMLRHDVFPDFMDSKIFVAMVGAWVSISVQYATNMMCGELEMAYLRHRFHLVCQNQRKLSKAPIAE